MNAQDAAELELIRQTGLVLVAVIGVLGTILTVLLNRTRQHAKAARDQVENDHTTNLRDEADQRHRANTSRLGLLERRTKAVESSLGRIEDHLGIERTLPRPPRRRRTP